MRALSRDGKLALQGYAPDLSQRDVCSEVAGMGIQCVRRRRPAIVPKVPKQENYMSNGTPNLMQNAGCGCALGAIPGCVLGSILVGIITNATISHSSASNGGDAWAVLLSTLFGGFIGLFVGGFAGAVYGMFSAIPGDKRSSPTNGGGRPAEGPNVPTTTPDRPRD